MTERNDVFQSSVEQQLEDYATNLFRPDELFTGFRTPAKAADVSLCTLDELNLGYMGHEELARALDQLNDYLREEAELYERGTRFYNLLNSAAMRIRWLARREPKETFNSSSEETPVAVLLERALAASEDTLNQTYQHRMELIDLPGDFDGDKGPSVDIPSKDSWLLADDIKGPAEFVPADGAPIEQAPEVPKEFTDKYPMRITMHGRIGVVGAHTSGILMSAAFGLTFGEARRTLMARGEAIGRITTLFNRIAFKMGIYDNHSMEELAMALLRKHPDMSSQLVLICVEVGNPFWQSMRQRELDDLLAKLQEVVKIVDYREGEFANG